MHATISTLADIHPDAEIGDRVAIGPFCNIGPDVTIGTGTRLVSHVTLSGRCAIGRFNQIFPGVVIGTEPQDLRYRGEDTRVRVGNENIIRESVTIHRGTQDGTETSIGDQCFLMAGAHVAHDCRVGNGVVIANNTLLGGHVHVGPYATVSGHVGIHHFTSIGAYSFVAGMSRVVHDIPPFMLCEGDPARPRCVNLVGLRRHDFDAASIEALAEAHRLIYRQRIGLDQSREILRRNGQLLPAVNELLVFVQEQHEGRYGRSRDRRSAA